MSNNSHYWVGKHARAETAKEHVTDMSNRYSKEIDYSASNTIVYDSIKSTVGSAEYEIELVPLDSVSAVLQTTGKTCVLNFASYKYPGGMYLQGSKAQEECLCHESTLYNVLVSQSSYYEYNNQNLNRALYQNRALYSPNIIFERDGVTKTADVITCAAPNYSTASYYYNVDKKTNSKHLRSRIRFILSCLSDKDLDTIVLGAFGCGVFGQDPTEVASIFIEEIKNVFHSNRKTKFVFAIIDANSDNYQLFSKVIRREN